MTGTRFSGQFMGGIEIALPTYCPAIDKNIWATLRSSWLAAMQNVGVTDSGYCWHSLSPSIFSIDHSMHRSLGAVS